MSDEVAARYPTQSLMTEYSQPEEVLEAEWKSVPHCVALVQMSDEGR